jgi:DNA invertase Pin-like site-specific DNA recombinase
MTTWHYRVLRYTDGTLALHEVYCAKARGVKMGPKFKLTAHQQREAIRRRDTKGEPVREIARTFNVSHSTISRLQP